MAAASTSPVTDVASYEQFDEIVRAEPGRAAVIFFWAEFEPTSAAGGAMDTVFARLAAMNASARFLRADAEKFPRLTTEAGVQVVPSFVVLRGGKVAARVEGADPAAVARTITGALRSPADGAAAVAAAAPPAVPAEPLEDRLRRLISSSRVMLFMKGSPEAPRCGFSRSIVEVLRSTGVAFGSFDILTDNDVREGLKKLSNWPTYPQLYVAGKLVGGLDVVREMAEEGELADLLAE